MADLHKFTSKEVLNKVLLTSGGSSVAAFSHTTAEALNAALDSANSRLNISLAGGTISGDVTISGDLTISGSATYTYDEQVDGQMWIKDSTTSSASQGGHLKLFSDDGAAMADNHRLGVIEFAGAEDASSTITVGARIEAICDAAWSATENGTELLFYTTDGNASQGIRFLLDSNSRISLSNNDSGTNNTIFGKSAGASIVSGANDNVLIGPEAGDAITIGDDNIAVGYGALGAETVGQSSVAIGTAAAANQAKSGGTQGHMRNTAIGTTALYYNVTGTQNTFLGADSGVGVSGNSHSNNTGIGYLALSGITTADYSVAIGSSAGTGITAHDYNIAIGKDSLRVCNDGYNVAIGAFSLEDGTNSYSNIAIGGYALNKHTGANTVAIGESALQKNTSGTENVAVGYQAMVENTDGINNTAIGFKAYRVGVQGDGNTAVGSNALLVATPAENAGNNTAIGSKSLLDCTTGAQNTALGCFSGQNITEGGLNTMLGWNAGATLTTGGNNICIGESSDVSASGATNQIAIGKGCTAVGDNSVTLGNASVTAVYASSDSGAIVHCAGIGDGTDTLVAIDTSNNVKINGAGVQDTGNPGWTFVAGNSNQGSILEHACGDAGEQIATFRTTSGVAGSITTSGTSTTFATSSDYRLKENEVAISDGLTRINQLKPYRFNWKHDKDTTVDGFFAHEVSEVVPEAIVGLKDAVNDKGEIDPQGIDQSKLVPLLVKAVQELSAKVTELENK